MFFQKKPPQIKKTNFNGLEKEILKLILQELDVIHAKKLNNQIDLLIGKKRLEYPKSLVSEFYPNSFNDITPDNLFARTEEFKLASLKILINNAEFYCQCNMVLGQIFDISIKPKPTNHDLNNTDITLKEIKMERELNRNLFS